jgi:hypothetical protein
LKDSHRRRRDCSSPRGPLARAPLLRALFHRSRCDMPYLQRAGLMGYRRCSRTYPTQKK